MIVYKDIVGNNEVLSKAYIDKEEEFFYVCKGKLILPDIEDGTNPEEVEKVIDIPYKLSLEEIEGFDKKMFMSAMKAVMKHTTKKLKKTMDEEALKAWKTKFAAWIDTFVKNEFGDCTFYSHMSVENWDENYIIICKWVEADPFFYYLKDALKEEKY